MHLRAAHDDGVVALGGDAGVKIGFELPVRRLGAIDRGMNDHVAHVEILVRCLGRKAQKMVRKLSAAARVELRRAGKARKNDAT